MDAIPAEHEHRTVLLNESVDALALSKGAVVVDATAGSGGHSEAIVKRFGADVRLICVDADADAVERAKKRLLSAGAVLAGQAEAGQGGASFHRANFRDLDLVLAEAKVERIDAILFDLGWSTPQFESSGRGFSFAKDEPLIMTFDKPEASASSGKPADYRLTAYDVVNEWEEATLADVIFGYGEERYARRIARSIVAAREKGPIATTGALVEAIRKAVPAAYRTGRIHFATRTFQALRIAVNDELGALRQGLLKGFYHLSPNGRMAVISFHSVEDRIVKRFFKEKEDEGAAETVFKKPLVASDAELAENRRARSAKLRALRKI